MLSSLSKGFSKIGLSLFFAGSVLGPHSSDAAGKEAGPSDTASTQSTREPASIKQGSEKEVLREFVKIYQSSRTFKELAVRTGAHRGVSSDYMSDVLGPAYLSPLPKMSFDLEKLTVSFFPSAKGKGKSHSFCKKASLLRKRNPFTRGSGVVSVLRACIPGRRVE